MYNQTINHILSNDDIFAMTYIHQLQIFK